MKKWIAAAVVVVLVIAAAVWYKAGSAPAVAETPETAATPAPTATPVPTPTATPVSDEGLQFEFDLYVETYKYDNNVTEDDLRNDQDTRYAMYEYIYSSGYDHRDASEEKEDGCDNEFIDEFMQYSLDRNLEKIPDPSATETPADVSGSGEYTIENYNKITNEEWAAMSDEEKQKWREVRNKELGGITEEEGNWISEEKTQEAFDILNDPNNPYVQEIIEYKQSLNN